MTTSVSIGIKTRTHTPFVRSHCGVVGHCLDRLAKGGRDLSENVLRVLRFVMKCAKGGGWRTKKKKKVKKGGEGEVASRNTVIEICECVYN